MQFVRPDMLWLLLLLPLLAVAGWIGARRRRNALAKFAGSPAFVSRFTDQVSVHRRAAKVLLLLVVAAACILALARPQWGARLEAVRARGLDVMVVLDTSLSMAAADVAPSRFGQARHAVGTLIQRLAGNRIGVVTFAGEATLTCPLTPDHEAVRLFLDALDVETVPVPGTSLASALVLAARALGQETSRAEEHGRAIVLFSDGEDHAGGIEQALEPLRRGGVTVYAVGCGSVRGAPIPLHDAAGRLSGYKKDREGKIVTTRLAEEALRTLALETGGRYYRTTPTESEIDEITQALSRMETAEFGATLRPRYEERFQIPLALALIALLGETLLGERKRLGGGTASRSKAERS